MRSTIKYSTSNEAGYTLIELAVSIIVAGLLIAPAFGLYTLYMKNQRIQQTDFALSQAQNALGGFRSLHGRYPCPADPTLPPTDPNYGYESNMDCSLAPAAGINVVTSLNGALADPDVWIGALPFRSLNMQENSTIDGYGARLTYAVTRSLTDDATFNVANGGISLLDINDNSFITPADAAHFVVISHGENNEGAYSREGVVIGACAVAGLLEIENCNNDSVFRLGSPQATFDDKLLLGSPIGITQWQYSETDINDIHLVSADNIALGDTSAINFASAADAEIRLSSNSDGVILTSTGAFLTSSLCTGDGSLCFAPEAIGGITPTGGMYCNTAAGEFLVGIENGGPKCASEIWFSCPPGQFFQGFNPDGTIACSVSPPASCPTEFLTMTCGDTRSITGTYSGGYSFGYSGSCQMIPSLTAADYTYFDTAPSFAAIQSYVDAITTNYANRTNQPCGDLASNALVRDAFLCTAGTWSIAKTTERLSTSGSWNASPTGGNDAEIGYVGLDASNTNNNHDCWCREDYRARQVSCPSGYSGNGIVVEKHACPQTDYHNWQGVYSRNDFCVCNPGPDPSVNTDCDNYFGVPNNSLSGTVTETSYYICDGSGNRVLDPSYTPNPQVAMNCTCEDKSTNPQITTASCPWGFTNSFTFDGRNYNNKAEVFYDTWSCPNGFGNPANAASLAGSWSGPVSVHTEPCVCNTSMPPQNSQQLCSSVYSDPTLTGYVYYQATWDCSASPPAYGTPVQVGEDCMSCSWKRPSTGAPYSDPYSIGEDIGAPCTCYTTAANCNEPSGSMYDVYNSCQCAP